jgi:hypothetical protein
VRAFGILIFAFVGACASPADTPDQVQSKPKGPECGHGALDADPHNCGTCGYDCTQLPGVNPSAVKCNQGVCEFTGGCEPGRAHCSNNPDDGCEADLSAAATCGACGTSCGAGTCAPDGSGSYMCQSSCSGSSTECSGSCVDLATDAKNCGACGNACPQPANGSAACAAGQCGLTCDSGFTLTNGACVSVVVNMWSPETSNTTDALYGVWGAATGEVYIVGDQGTILQATGGGAFADQSASTRYTLAGLFGFDSGHVITVGIDNRNSEGAVLRTQTDGSFAGNGFATDSLVAVWGVSANDIWAVGGSGQIMHNTMATTWSQPQSGTTRNLWAVWGSGASDVYAVGDRGVIVHYDGSSWSRQSSPATTTLTGLWGSSATDVYAVGFGGEVLHNDGSGWSEESSGVTDDLNAITGVGSDLFVVGSGGVILHRSGGTWSPEMSGTTRSLWAVWGSSTAGVYAVGDAGTILHR